MTEPSSLISELRATMGKLEVALGAIPDGIVWTSEDGTIQWCNGAFDRLVACPHILVLGSKLVELLALNKQGGPLAPEEHPVTLALTGGRAEADRSYAFPGAGGEALLAFAWTPVQISVQETNLVFVIRDVTERQRATEEMRQAREALTAAYREMEAFSYSVAHDLRAPLRHVDGLSQLLLDGLNGRIDVANRDLLLRIRGAAVRMGQLIDGLLDLSRIGRTEICRAPVNLSRLARSIAAELRESRPERWVTFVIPEGLTAQGDARLLRVALANLLTNAWKFTEPHAPASIELGARPAPDGQTVYFVRDNGVGFDMAYSDKLFGMFERLHPAAEFPGTGIGLATTQRIIRRHGGAIWAEGDVGKGATFYFTLGA